MLLLIILLLTIILADPGSLLLSKLKLYLLSRLPIIILVGPESPKPISLNNIIYYSYLVSNLL